MILIKKAHQLQWPDLEYIEHPVFAVSSSLQFISASSQKSLLISNLGLNPNDWCNGLAAAITNGHLFCINYASSNRVLKNVKNIDQQLNYELAQVVELATNTFKFNLINTLNQVKVPSVYVAIHKEPGTENEQEKKPTPTLFSHRILVNPIPEEDCELPYKHQVTVFIEKSDGSRVFVKQVKDLINGGLTSVFKAKENEEFNVYCIEGKNQAVLEDLKKNRNIKHSVENGLISALDIVSTEELNSGIKLHTVDYTVPDQLDLIFDYEWAPSGDQPKSEYLVLTNEDNSWRQIRSVTAATGDRHVVRVNRNRVKAKFVDLPKDQKLSLFAINQEDLGASPSSLFSSIIVNKLVEEEEKKAIYEVVEPSEDAPNEFIASTQRMLDTLSNFVKEMA